MLNRIKHILQINAKYDKYCNKNYKELEVRIAYYIV